MNVSRSKEDVEGGAVPRKRKNPFKLQQLKDEKDRRKKKRARLIVRNVSYKATEDTLRKHFEQWGTLEDLNILKRPDGKLVGCAFVQYESITQATKAILSANKQPLLGRPIFVDWAVGKDEFQAKQNSGEPTDKEPKLEVKEENNAEDERKQRSEKLKVPSDQGEDEDEQEEQEQNADDSGSLFGGDEEQNDESMEHSDDQSDGESNSATASGEECDGAEQEPGVEAYGDDDDKDKKHIANVAIKKEKRITNDVVDGCTVFVKNVPYDAEENDLRKVFRKFGLLHYVIINREHISGHSKGTAFVKYKAKESADLCLQAGTDLKLLDQVMEVLPALSRTEIKERTDKNSIERKDSRNLYLTREGLIMSGSKAAESVSAADMKKRHELEQVKVQVLKNLNRFVSRNRLSIHNLPLHYDNDKLKQMLITYTGYRPHECRVMRENKITPEHPKGMSKGFGFMSFSSHQEALNALRKLNNNPKVFGPQHRPIVAFSIEDRGVHQVKEKRKERSKLNNPTYKAKLEKRKQLRAQKLAIKPKQFAKGPLTDNKDKLKKHIERLEKARLAKTRKVEDKKAQQKGDFESYMGAAAQQGTSTNMRSYKKIKEQAQEHMKRVKADKRKKKQQKIRQIHFSERQQSDRMKQKRKLDRDDLAPLVNKYKRMLTGKGNESQAVKSEVIAKEPKRTKWYAE